MPEWLKGSLIRVGPGKFNEGDFSFNHWQDGMAVMYKFAISPGGNVSVGRLENLPISKWLLI